MTARFFFSGVVLVSVIAITAAFSRDTEIRIDTTCTDATQCGDNRYCNSDGVCECKPGTYTLGKTCIEQKKIGESCFSNFQCPILSRCSETKSVCECEPNTVKEHDTCKPTADFKPPTAPPTNRRVTERVKGHDNGTLAMTVTMVIIMLVLTFAAAYELTKIKKYIAKSQTQYKKAEDADEEYYPADETDKLQIYEPPPEYHTVVKQDNAALVDQ